MVALTLSLRPPVSGYDPGATECDAVIRQVSWRTTPHLSKWLRAEKLPALMHAVYSYPFDRIKRLYDINVHGAFFTAREAARNMIPQGGGSIVLVASMSASVRF